MKKLAPTLVAALVAPAALAASAPPPDWSEVRSHTEAARKLAGADWGVTVDKLCIPGGAPNDISDPAIQPIKLFDDLYVVGDRGTLVFILDTPEGLILIDALYPQKTQSVLLPGMRALGLDPARVKYVLVTHGHADHFGGAAWFQETYGARVGVSARDWTMIEGQTGAGRPRRDLVLEDGRPVTLGGVQVVPVDTPGHTPGSMGFLFQVKDKGATRWAGVYGSALLRPYRNEAPDLLAQRASLKHFADAARKVGVEVEVQNHPLFDGFFDKAARLEAAGPAAPNPFVVGREGYQRFLRVMDQCMAAGLARRGVQSR
jgi:metallo-beta-lactamase class B